MYFFDRLLNSHLFCLDHIEEVIKSKTKLWHPNIRDQTQDRRRVNIAMKQFIQKIANYFNT